MRLPVFFAALLLAMGVPAPPAGATSLPQSERAPGDLNHYHAMVVAYRDGNDEVIADLLTWEKRRLFAAISLINTSQDRHRPWPDGFLRSAALMQTAAALKCFETKAGEAAVVHLGAAVSLLKYASERLPFASQWTYAVSRLLRSWNLTADAERVLEMGRELVPVDPLILYESGVLQEMFATHWQTAQGQPHARTMHDVAPLDGIRGNREARLDQARRWLSGSVTADPSNHMARLHLGRVLMMRGDDDEALRLLERVRDETSDRAMAYLALMFAGAVHERKGLLDQATAAYRQAIERFPEGHSVYIALSEVLNAAGQGDEARAVLSKVLTEAKDKRREPWSWYFIEPREVPRERIQLLFAEGRR